MSDVFIGRGLGAESLTDLLEHGTWYLALMASPGTGGIFYVAAMDFLLVPTLFFLVLQREVKRDTPR